MARGSGHSLRSHQEEAKLASSETGGGGGENIPLCWQFCEKILAQQDERKINSETLSWSHWRVDVSPSTPVFLHPEKFNRGSVETETGRHYYPLMFEANGRWSEGSASG